jgi:hypothetical protein
MPTESVHPGVPNQRRSPKPLTDLYTHIEEARGAIMAKIAANAQANLYLEAAAACLPLAGGCEPGSAELEKAYRLFFEAVARATDLLIEDATIRERFGEYLIHWVAAAAWARAFPERPIPPWSGLLRLENTSERETRGIGSIVRKGANGRKRRTIPSIPVQVGGAFEPGAQAFWQVLQIPEVAAHLDRATQHMLLACEFAALGGWESVPCREAMLRVRSEVCGAADIALVDPRLAGWGVISVRELLDCIVRKRVYERRLPGTVEKYRASRKGGLPRGLEGDLRKLIRADLEGRSIRWPVPPEKQGAVRKWEDSKRGKRVSFQGGSKGQLRMAQGAFYPLLEEGLGLCGTDLTLARLADFMQVDPKLLRRYFNHPDYGPRWIELKRYGALAACKAHGWRDPRR